MARVAAPSPPYVGPPKFYGGTRNKPIKRIVIHCTAGAEPGVKGAARSTAAYTKRTTRPSSWHYCADAAESVQLTWDSVVAYHCGYNSNSIGYELCCSLANEGRGHWDRPDHVAMMKIAAEDCARLALAYGVPIRKLTVAQVRDGQAGFCGHVDIRDAFPGVTTHWDPGPFFPWRLFLMLVQAAADRLMAEPEPPVTPTPVPTWRHRVVTWNMDYTDDVDDWQAGLDAITRRPRVDVVLLQEAKRVLLRRLVPNGWRLHWDPSDPARAGSAVLVRDDVGEFLDEGHTLLTPGAPGIQRRWMQWVLYQLDGDTRPTLFGSVHLPPGRLRRLWPLGDAALRGIVARQRAAGHRVVLGGDWNRPNVLFGRSLGMRVGNVGIDGFLTTRDVALSRVKRLPGNASDHDPVAAWIGAAS